MKAETSLPKQNQEINTHNSHGIYQFWENMDEIKDYLRLKLCNANIYAMHLTLMDIQQWEKESLAAFVHQFETEAKRCNFTMMPATIRIFIKGLRNVQSSAVRIYEKIHKH